MSALVGLWFSAGSKQTDVNVVAFWIQRKDFAACIPRFRPVKSIPGLPGLGLAGKHQSAEGLADVICRYLLRRIQIPLSLLAAMEDKAACKLPASCDRLTPTELRHSENDGI